MNPTCWLAERRLSAAVARDRAPEPWTAQHRDACPRCRAFHTELRRLNAALGALETPLSAPDLDAAVLARLAANAPPRRRPAGLAVGAAALLASGALLALRPAPTPPAQIAALTPAPRSTDTRNDTPGFRRDTPGPSASEGSLILRLGYRDPQHRRSPMAPLARRGAGGVPARTRGVASAPVDDLAFVNGDTFDAYARRTSALLRRDPDPLLAALPEIHGGDDFVAVPLPQLASVGDAGVADALNRYEQEKQIVDSRLQRAVTLGAKRISLADLCALLSQKTDIAFTASRAVADDKITLFCKDRPVRDLLRQLTRLLGFTWERSGKDDAWTYTLTEPLKVRLLEEELRNRDRNEALLALDREMDAYKSLLGLTPDEARGQAEQTDNERERQRLKKLGGLGWGPAQLYRGLSSDERDALLSGKSLNFGGGAVPDSLRQSMLDALRGHVFLDGSGGVNIYGDRDSDAARAQKGLPPGEVPGVEPTASLRLQRNELGEFSLYGYSGYSNKGSGGSSAVELAKGISPSAASPNNADANAARKNEPAFQKKIALGGDEKPKGRRTTADLLEAIHKATGRDVIGDYFTRLYDPEKLWGRTAVTTFDALNRACDATRLRWSDTEKWLTFRSTDFFNMRLKEVPNRLLDRWAATRKERPLDSDTLREIARLTDFQLDAGGMAEGARVLWGLDEWDEVRSENLRPVWRFFDSLTGAQQATMRGDGLRYGGLGLDAQQRFLRLIYYPGDEIRQRLESGNADPLLLQRLAGATMTLTNDPARLPKGVIGDSGERRPWYLVTQSPAGANHTRLGILGSSTMASNEVPESAH